MNDFLGKMYISTITGAGGSDHEEREAAEGFTELVPRLETTWNVDAVKANGAKISASCFSFASLKSLKV